jgi:carbon-monoxide dehydrogenase medium subunit
MQVPTPGLFPFDYIRPASLSEACRLLAEHGGEAHPFMGGTDIFVQMRDGAVCPGFLVDVKHLPGMRDIEWDDTGGLTIGAAATMNDIARHPDVRTRYPLLAEAANSVASYQVRNRATIGGNLCNGSPCADIAPATLVLEGRAILQGLDGERELEMKDFFLGPGETSLRVGELMTAVRYPLPPAGSAGRYLKLGRSKVGDLAIVSVAVLGFPAEETPSGYRFRIALGAVAPTVIRAPAAEAVLAQNPPGEDTFALAADEAMEAAVPIDDVRASAVYRRAMVRNLTLRGFRDVWAQIKKG